MFMLMPCLYCGKDISSTASVCPHCSNGKPLGLVCIYCSGAVREDKAINLNNGHHSCQECIERNFAIPNDLQCPDCHMSLVGQIPLQSFVCWDEHPPHPVCPGCGNSELFRSYNWCADCTVPIYAALGQKSDYFGKQVFINDHNHLKYGGVPVHTFCRTARARSKEGGCFVVTAAYGARDLNVVLLQAYRDRILNESVLGRSAMRFYYLTSPSLARFIEASDRRRSLVRAFLCPLVLLARKQLERSGNA